MFIPTHELVTDPIPNGLDGLDVGTGSWKLGGNKGQRTGSKGQPWVLRGGGGTGWYHESIVLDRWNTPLTHLAVKTN